MGEGECRSVAGVRTSLKRPWCLLLIFVVAVALPATARAAAPRPLFEIPPNSIAPGLGAGELFRSRSVAADPNSGHIFVSDNENARISEFTSWGEFVKAWGWGVADGSPELQTCGPLVPELNPPPALCRQGIEGTGSGQLLGPNGLAVDGGGNVYVLDTAARRVTKYSPDGDFVLMFGGEVDKTKTEEAGSTEAERNLCTAVSGDACQAGTAGTGKGQFGSGPAVDRIAVGPGEKIYVGDVNRIQRFSSGGQFETEFPVVGSVKSLDVDSAGNIYYILAGTEVVHKLDSSGAPIGPIFPVTGPWAVAMDPAGNVYVADLPDGETGANRVVGFDAAGNVTISPGDDFADTGLLGADVQDLATNRRCPGAISGGVCTTSGVDCPEGAAADFFVAYSNVVNPPLRSFVGVFGPAPCFEPPPPVPPSIKSQFAVSVGSEGAEVQAQINPRFWNDTTYYVEYGTGQCFSGGCTETRPAPPGALLSEEVVNAAITTQGVFLPGLEPGTTYHYRFVAESGGGGPVRGAGGTVGSDGAEASFTTPPAPSAPKSDCPNQAFRSGAAARLPDCRAYEMVSPVDKGGGDILAFRTQRAHPSALTQSAPGGGLFTYSSYRSFGDAQSAPYTSQYLASRGADGWSSTGISPPRENGSFKGDGGPYAADREFKAFSEDLCTSWLGRDANPPLTAVAPPNYVNLYERNGCGTPSYRAMVDSVPASEEGEHFFPELQGFSKDGRCTVFRANDAVTTVGTVPSGEKEESGEPITQLYESCEGQLRLVSVMPDGTASPVTSSAGTITEIVDVDRNTSLQNATSADGSRIYWTQSKTRNGGRIYLRKNAEREQSALAGEECLQSELACTVPVSQTVSEADAQFWAAAEDGSKALFSIGSSLYLFNAEATGGEEPTALVAAGFEGVVAASQDLSRVYLVSEEVLSGGEENSEGAAAEAGEPNLYLWSGGSFAFVGTLADNDNHNELSLISPRPINHFARATADGATLAFMSTASLTGYDNADQNSGEPAAEIYLYRAGSGGELDCVSCNPTGARPAARDLAFRASPYFAAARLPAYESSLYAPRALSVDGSRLFFESFDGLLPRDTNHKEDVYEWQRAENQADCLQTLGGEMFLPASSGCLALISSGESAADSSFLDATPDGSDAFFATSESLVAQDPGQIDVYDARIDGGFPAPAPALGPCQGADCQNPPPSPSDTTPASRNYQGPGNLAPPKKKHHRKHHRKKKHHKKKATAKGRAQR